MVAPFSLLSLSRLVSSGGPPTRCLPAARPEQLKLIEQLVNIDSGTGDVEGGRKVAAVLAARLKALGFTIESAPAEIPGLPENTVATLRGAGKGRILLIGHIDTVFGPGTAAKRPYAADADKAYLNFQALADAYLA